MVRFPDKASAGQSLFDGTQTSSAILGWSGFLDLRFILNSLGILLLAALLGALIGYHPATKRTIDKLHEADMPHVYVMYAVIGAVIGVAVAGIRNGGRGRRIRNWWPDPLSVKYGFDPRNGATDHRHLGRLDCAMGCSISR